MMSLKMQTAINDQINLELWSAYLYLAMSMDCEAKGLKGVAHWFLVQWMEEQDHAHIFANYLNSFADKRVVLRPIESVPTTWESPLVMFKDAVKHEAIMTDKIYKLYSLAEDENDFATEHRLEWFVVEQQEEEDAVRRMVAAFEAAGCDKWGSSDSHDCPNSFTVYLLDKELSHRNYHRASALEE